MEYAQARAIADLIGTLDVPGHAQVNDDDDDEGTFYVEYMFVRPEGEGDWDIIASVGDFYRWLGYRGKASLDEGV